MSENTGGSTVEVEMSEEVTTEETTEDPMDDEKKKPNGVLIVRDPDKIVIQPNLGGQDISVPYLYTNRCDGDDVRFESVNNKIEFVDVVKCNFEENIENLVRMELVETKSKETKQCFTAVSLNGSSPTFFVPLSFKTNKVMSQVSIRSAAKTVERGKQFKHNNRVYNQSDGQMYFVNRYELDANRYLVEHQGFEGLPDYAKNPKCQVGKIERPKPLIFYSTFSASPHPVRPELVEKGYQWMKDKYLEQRFPGSKTYNYDGASVELAVDIVENRGVQRFKVKDFNVKGRSVYFTLDFFNVPAYQKYADKLPPFEVAFLKFASKNFDPDERHNQVSITFWPKNIAHPKYNLQLPPPVREGDEVEAKRKYTFSKRTDEEFTFVINRENLKNLEVTLTTEFRMGGRFPTIQSVFFKQENKQYVCCVEHGDVSKTWVGSYGTNFQPVHIDTDHGDPREMFIRWAKLTFNAHAYECIAMPTNPYTTHLEKAIVFFWFRSDRTFPWIKLYLPIMTTSCKKAGIVFPKPGLINKPYHRGEVQEEFSVYKEVLRLHSYLQCVCVEIAEGNQVDQKYVGQKFHFYVYDKKHFAATTGMAIVKMRMVPIAGQIFPDELLNRTTKLGSNGKWKNDGPKDAKDRYEQILYMQNPYLKWAFCNLHTISFGEAYRQKMRALLNVNELCPKLQLTERNKQLAKFVQGTFELDERNARQLTFADFQNFKHFFVTNGFPKPILNNGQIQAIINCCDLHIGLLWGPPGTGKTTTVAFMAVYECLNIFKKKTANDTFNKVTVVCAPSNEATNVAFEKICEILDSNPNNQIQVLRVFSSTYEEYQFPFKKGTKRLSTNEELMQHYGNDRYSDRWCQNKIRKDEETGEFAGYLRSYDENFKKCYEGKEFPKTEQNHFRSEIRYKRVRDMAERIVISKANIIVTTTSSFNYQRYNRFTVAPDPNENANNLDGAEFSNQNDDEDSYEDGDEVDAYMQDIQIVTPASYKNIRPIRFERVIFDEATMEPEPETQVALHTAKLSNFTFAGDDFQMGPVVKCAESKKFGACTSYFSRYASKNRELCAMLTTQYRMQIEIQKFPNMKFYEDKLEVGNETEQNIIRLNLFWRNFYDAMTDIRPVAFINVSGLQVMDENVLDDREKSFFNVEEVKVAVRLAKYLIANEGVSAEKIAILSIYSAQRKKMQEALIRNRIEQVVCRTVRTSQGKEWNYVILSCVKSRTSDSQDDEQAAEMTQGKLGLLGVVNDFNVAITRAKFGLILIGNEKVLLTNKNILKPWLDNHRHVNFTDDAMKKMFEYINFI